MSTYLRSEYIKVSGPIGSTDELAFVLGRDARILRNPNNGGTQPVGVQVQTIEFLTLLLAETLACKLGKRYIEECLFLFLLVFKISIFSKLLEVDYVKYHNNITKTHNITRKLKRTVHCRSANGRCRCST